LLLYDTGPGFSSGFNAGWSVIVPYLKNSGHRRIDKIVVSHGDSDHIGGLADVLKLMKVGSILTSVPDKIDFPDTSACLAGQHWQWDEIDFEILSPDIDDGLSGNNASCVLKISNASASVLMSGDIERRAEMLLLQRNTEKLDVDVLVAPHHGSATSSTSAFIAATSPEYVIFPTGYLNRFGFPKPDIIDRYTLYDTKMLNTAHDGAISIQFGNNGRGIMTERKKSLRYWHNDY
jgi:competence protein ComEC